MESFKILKVRMGDYLYQEERYLRNRELLQPFGLPDFSREVDDHKAHHFVAHAEGLIRGCVLLVPVDAEDKYMQLRQMAVSKPMQGCGVGRALVAEVLQFARKNGYVQVFCHAREEAIGFYEKCGFEPFGERFEEVGIPHQFMRLFL